MTQLLNVSNLSAYYGAARALDNISFSVGKGGITAVLGPNGAGKTTLLRAISGMVRISGRITFEAADITQAEPERAASLRVAHVPEDRGTFSGLTVDENLRAGCYLRSKRDVQRALEEVYELFPRLQQRRQQQAGTLSGGEQQMLAIGRALALDPRLILLDEPSFGVAPIMAEEIFAKLRQLNVQRGVSLLLVEQNATHAFEIADELLLLESGALQLAGKAAELKSDPRIAAGYFGAI